MFINKSILSISILIFTISINGETVKFIKKYNSTKYSGTVECYYDYKNNTYIQKINNIVISKYTYKNKNDFIKERSIMGSTYSISQELYMLNTNKKYKSMNTFDDQQRLSGENSEIFNFIWNKWDTKKRNISGKVLIKNISTEVIIHLEYHDNLKIAKEKYSRSAEVIKKHPHFPIEAIFKFDDYNNMISIKTKLSNGKETEEIKSNIEYDNIK
jgi:hypothetical protein